MTMKTRQLKNLWDEAKAVLRGTFTAKQSYLEKQEKHQINNLTLYIKQLETEEKKIVEGKKSYKDMSRNK